MKIAVPNKGSLAELSIAVLKEAGYRQRTDSRDLVLVDSENNVEFYYLRPRDIALYVGSGELHAGITGRDLLIEEYIDLVGVDLFVDYLRDAEIITEHGKFEVPKIIDILQDTNTRTYINFYYFERLAEEVKSEGIRSYLKQRLFI